MNSYKPLEAPYYDIENSFYLNCENERLGKLLSHYEIYKEIANLPGDIIELGVFKGASLVRWATFRNLIECQSSRRITGFDAFGNFPTAHLEHKGCLQFAKEHDTGSGVGISKTDLEQVFEKKGIGNINLMEGDIFDSLPTWLEHNPYTRIALLHLDMDVYEPTIFALEELWSRLVPGGALVVDDYNAVDGATAATDEFFAREGKNFSRISKAAFYHVPTVFIK